MEIQSASSRRYPGVGMTVERMAFATSFSMSSQGGAPSGALPWGWFMKEGRLEESRPVSGRRVNSGCIRPSLPRKLSRRYPLPFLSFLPQRMSEKRGSGCPSLSSRSARRASSISPVVGFLALGSRGIGYTMTFKYLSTSWLEVGRNCSSFAQRSASSLESLLRDDLPERTQRKSSLIGPLL